MLGAHLLPGHLSKDHVHHVCGERCALRGKLCARRRLLPGDIRFSSVKAQTSGGHFEAGLSVSGD